MNHIFHVHTWRCKHASDETDEQYIKTALSLGARKITFTDHTPFPIYGFKNRMEYSELAEYVSTLKSLKEKYSGTIEVVIGLEVEYMPFWLDFYKELKNKFGLEVLIIGQHFFENENGGYSFDNSEELKQLFEASGCGKAIIDGMKTGLFDAVAHPDRIFKRTLQWTEKERELSMKIIKTASELNIPLEKNLSSYEKFITKTRTCYWKNEFWQLVEDFNLSSEVPVEVIYGVDAHSLEEMISRYKYADILDYESAMRNIQN